MIKTTPFMYCLLYVLSPLIMALKVIYEPLASNTITVGTPKSFVTS